MADVTCLSNLATQAAQATTGATRSFTAAVQHVATAKRMRVNRGDAPPRVASYHVVHVADQTKSFFKLLCWGEALPAFQREDHDGDDITTICVGDIVLFSSCKVKSFRGNVEAQYTRHSSVKLLYRRDRYFNTRDVRLKDLYPMIEWYKQHRHVFLVDEKTPSGDVAFTSISDLREEMLVNLSGTIHECKQSDREMITTSRPLPNSSDFDGVHLCEVTIQDTPSSIHTIILNLWDQYADPRFVTRLLTHRGTVHALGVVISHNTMANRLLANTTPRTEFRFVDSETVETESEGDAHSAKQERHFATVAALENASVLDGHVLLESVVIEHVLLGRIVGPSDRVDAAFTPLLVESYCSVCEQILPIVGANTRSQLYAFCKNRCRVQQGQRERLWRYRTVRMVLRDAKQGCLTVQVGDTVLTKLLGNIQAELLIHPQGFSSSGSILPFNPREMVANLLNHLVRGGPGPQVYEAELQRRRGKPVQDRRRSLLLLNDSLREGEETATDTVKTSYTVVSMSATIQSPW